MDSITHIALGACLGEAALSKQAGKKALILGAIAQSLPDVDVVAALWLHPVDNLLFHRSVTHSLLFNVAAAALLSFSARKIARLQEISFIKLFVFFCLQIWLHDVLDTCNAYGTGLFEPFSHQRFSFHLLFVVDPFFSLSLVIAFVALVILKKDDTKRKRWVLAGLLPALLYLFHGVYNKALVKTQVQTSLLAEHIAYKSVMITPTPFNTWLWYVVAATDSGYEIGYCSVFDKKNVLIPFTYYQKNEKTLNTVDKTIDMKRLIKFADNYYTVEHIDTSLVFNVLRFGQIFGWQDTKARFSFQYFLDPSYDNSLVVQRGRFKGWNRKTLMKMYDRIKGN
jgi:inner membrane protein